VVGNSRMTNVDESSVTYQVAASQIICPDLSRFGCPNIGVFRSVGLAHEERAVFAARE